MNKDEHMSGQLTRDEQHVAVQESSVELLPSSPWIRRRRINKRLKNLTGGSSSTMTPSPCLAEDSNTVLLLRESVLEQQQDRETPVLGRCSSSSSLSEMHEPCPMEKPYYVITESCSADDVLSSTYTLRRRRTYSDDRTPVKESENGDVVPGSPSTLKMRVRNSIDCSKRRIGEMKGKMRQRFRRRREAGRSTWLIPADHPCKVAWDVLTVALSLYSAYTTHAHIRDRSFGHSNFWVFCEIWFLLDILLNFVTEHKTSEGLVIRDGKAVWARYLTSWFVVDALSLVPWESLYVKPIIEMQSRRNFFKKTFFRSRAVIRVTRLLRGRHLRLFGQVASHTKRAGVGGKRLLRLLIKYVPKYLLFYRNMKGVLAVRTLRQVHWMRKVMKSFLTEKIEQDDDTYSLSDEEEFEDDDDDSFYNDEDGEEIHVFEYENDDPLDFQ